MSSNLFGFLQYTNIDVMIIASSKSSHLCLPARVTYVTSSNSSETQPDQVSENATFCRHLTMAVIHLAEISSVLNRSYTLFTFKLCGRYAFGGCPWFHMKPSVSAAGTVIRPWSLLTVVYICCLLP